MTKTFALLTAALLAGPAVAGDNELTAQEKAAGWLLLFDGRTLDGWMTSSETPSKTPVEDGCINPHKSGGYMMIHKKQWGDYILSCDRASASKPGHNPGLRHRL